MQNNESEVELVQKAIAGDRAALSELLLTYYDDLQRQVSVKISNDLRGLVRAEDIMQQTFVRVAQAIGTFEMRHPRAFRAWLKTIALNLLKDAEKRRRRERRTAARRPVDGSRDTTLIAEAALCDDTSPSGRFQRLENIRRMRLAVESLPADQREAIKQYYLQDLSLAEVAESMGRTTDAIRGICFRARKNLRAMIGGSSLFFSR